MTIQFGTDSHSVVGFYHSSVDQSGQDYTTSGVGDGMAYGIVCDGCSDGGRTDVGARVIALATASALRQYWDAQRSITEDFPREVGQQRQRVLETCKHLLDLEPRDLYTTCAFALVSPDGGLIHMHGDGILAAKLRSGSIVMTRFEWEDNIPAYVGYDAEDHYAAFIAAHGGDLAAKRFTAEQWEYCSEQGFHPLALDAFTLEEGIAGMTTLLTREELAQIEFLAIFSDGAADFADYDWKEVVVNLLAFKPGALAGKFATRRMNAFVNDARARSSGPQDDLSYAVIHVKGAFFESQGGA